MRQLDVNELIRLQLRVSVIIVTAKVALFRPHLAPTAHSLCSAQTPFFYCDI